MLIAIMIAIWIIIPGVVLAWVGIELTFRPPQTDAGKLRIRIALDVSVSALIVFTGLN